jgi:plasmid stabilization system protein ParE
MSRTVVWSAQARDQFVASLTYIAQQDPRSADLVYHRVEKSLSLLTGASGIGVQAPASGVRTYAVPKTGHSFDYRLVGDQLRVQRFYRQRQMPSVARR